jgi:thiol-disulfide isomerase/thioredoxin
MKMRLAIVFVCLTATLFLVGLVVPAQSTGGTTAGRGEIREINLDDLKKTLQRDPKDTRPLLVNFWATWCDGCREEFPDLVKIDNDYRTRGLNFLSVTVDDLEDKGLAANFLKEMKATMPVVLLNVSDKDAAIHAIDQQWGGELPATFVYGRAGTVIYRHFGKIKSDELRAVLDKEVTSAK